MTRRLDEVDKRILYHLVEDARDTSAPQIADEVNVSAGTIRNRIRQLEDDGILEGYHAQIDYERVEGRLTNLFVCTVPVEERERLAQQVLDVPGVVHVRELMTGRGNLHVKAVGEDMGDLSRISRKLTNLGLEIRDEHLVQREHHRAYHAFGPDEQTDRSGIADFISLTGGAEVVELTVDDEAPLAGRTLKEANAEGLLDPSVLVIAIERGEETLTPRGDTSVEADDLVTVFSRRGIGKDTLAAFGTG